MALWFFDVNKRVYRERRSAPIWREHWRPLTVVKETAKNYVLDHPIWYGGRTTIRVAKPLNNDFALTEADIDRLERREIARVNADALIAQFSDDEVLALLTRHGLWPRHETEREG